MNSHLPMVARSGEDLLAMLPVLFGFQPEESFVLVSLSADRPMHARVDLARTRDEVAESLELLLGPARRHGIDRAVLCVLGDLARSEGWRPEITTAHRGSGIEVLEVVAADGRRWRPLGSGERPREYDVWSHPFVAQAVLEGRAVLPSRAALAETLAPVATHVAAVRDRLAGVPAPPLDAGSATAVVARLAAAGSRPRPGEVAALLVALRDPAVCLEVAAATTRTAARDHLPVWTAVVRASPDRAVAPAAAVLGFVAWLAGEGALAWCAVDRSRASGEECPLVAVVTVLLERAVRPDAWEEWRQEAGERSPG